ncbi:antitoxin [Williamsia maris]|uniref:MT0933-like antitoxin protein n=1 Tax=Williamsia maris TaxID=72806 RepID=A0ABT1HJD9_9NOCA|nr:antitoxin [Williamsia maris]MCP2178043.1 MT0933-like antitoxin protein [Williamsia maris]
MSFINKIEDLAGKHDDKVDKGLDKVGAVAKKKASGHDEQIDKVVGKAKDATRPQD